MSSSRNLLEQVIRSRPRPTKWLGRSSGWTRQASVTRVLHFTEMYAMDFRRDSVLQSHMGEGNWMIARKDRPIRLIDRRLDIGNLENPPTIVFMAEPGVATIASL